MKGPYHRLKFDLRRHWVCPVCQHHSHTPGHVTSCMCRCQLQVEPAARRFMKLVEDVEPRGEFRPPSGGTPAVSSESRTVETDPVSPSSDRPETSDAGSKLATGTDSESPVS